MCVKMKNETGYSACVGSSTQIWYISVVYDQLCIAHETIKYLISNQ